MHQSSQGRRDRSAIIHNVRAKKGGPEQLRTDGQPVDRDEQSAEGEPPRRTVARSARLAREELHPEDQGNEDEASDSQPLPRACAVKEGEEDLGPPLLVQPGFAGNRERERVDPKHLV
jgi:hypothetical protein